MDRLRRLLILIATAGVVGCTAPTASESPSAPASSLPSPAPASSPSAATVPSLAPAATPLTPAVSDAGPRLIWQANGSTADTTTASTVSVLTSGGQRRDLIDLPESDSTWPARIDATRGGDRAFLFGPALRGSLDLETGTMTRRPFNVAPFQVAASHDGRHLAWVDDVTGSSVTVVVVDAAGKHPTRLGLPARSWIAYPEFTPDDRAILALVLVPTNPEASGGIVLVETSRGDPGPLAAHIVRLPLDGSPLLDLADDAALVAADAEGMAPLPASVDLPKAVTSTHEILQPTMSPDGSRVAYLELACWSEKFIRLGTPSKTVCSDRAMGVRSDGSTPVVLADDLAAASALDWSPDGRTLVVRGTDRGGRSGLFTVDPDGGSDPALLLATTPDDPSYSQTSSSVRWSPDGAWILFGRGVDTWVVRADGSDAHEVVPHGVAAW
jgi:hypothetical protein